MEIAAGFALGVLIGACITLAAVYLTRSTAAPREASASRIISPLHSSPAIARRAERIEKQAVIHAKRDDSEARIISPMARARERIEADAL